MACLTALSFYRRVFVCERPLFVCVTLDTGRIGARRQSCLLQFEAAMWIVAVATLHGAF